MNSATKQHKADTKGASVMKKGHCCFPKITICNAQAHICIVFYSGLVERQLYSTNSTFWLDNGEAGQRGGFLMLAACSIVAKA